MSGPAASKSVHLFHTCLVNEIDPDVGMAGRCVQGLLDVLEDNYGGDVTKMPYVVNKEAFQK